MLPSDFVDDKPGLLISIGDGVMAFRPNDLPPRLPLGWKLARMIESATQAVATLAGTAGLLRNPHPLIRPLASREAVASSQIEGTQATVEDLFILDAKGAAPQTESIRADAIEVRNYVQALDESVNALETLPISLRLFRDAHRTLMSGARGEHASPGEWRRHQVHIGASGQRASEARYVPPPPGPTLMECLDAFEKYLHAPSDLPHLVRYALIHYQFEAIHPFSDGNGRLGRMIIPLLMIADGVMPQPLLYISSWFHRHRQQYYDLMLEVSTRNAWVPWIEFVLEGFRHEAEDTLRRCRRLVDLREEYHRRLADAPVASRVADFLFLAPYVDASGAQHLAQVSLPTAQRAIDRLVELGVLVEMTGKKRGRFYKASAVLAAISEPSAGG